MIDEAGKVLLENEYEAIDFEAGGLDHEKWEDWAGRQAWPYHHRK